MPRLPAGDPTMLPPRSAHEGRTPQVVGIDAAELEAAGAAMAQLGGPSGRALQDGAGGAGSRGLLQQGGLRADDAALALIEEEEEPAGDAAGLWGQREDKQVQVGARCRRAALVLPPQLVSCRQPLLASHLFCLRGRSRTHLVGPIPLSLPPSATLPAPQSLLEAVSVGAASMEELQERLQAELAALEVRARAPDGRARGRGGCLPHASSRASPPGPRHSLLVPPTSNPPPAPGRERARDAGGRRGDGAPAGRAGLHAGPAG